MRHGFPEDARLPPSQQWSGSGCRLAGADLEGADLEGVRFARADLRGADLRRTSRSAAQFFDPSESPHSGALLLGAELDGADLSGLAEEQLEFLRQPS
jgi:uncharacterized protein YjbI with pentapeptide repeats